MVRLLAKPGVRFAVQTEAGRQSTLWRFWPSTSDESVMLTPRLLAKHAHFTIHESGHCHFTLTSKEAIEVAIRDGREPKSGSVRLAEWRVSSDWVDGWQRPLSIFVPVSELRVVDRETEKLITWVRPGPGTQLVTIAVLIGPADADEDRIPLRGVRLESIAIERFRSRSVWLVVVRDASVPAWVLSEMDIARKKVPPTDSEGGQPGVFRFAGKWPDGGRIILDMGPPVPTPE